MTCIYIICICIYIYIYACNLSSEREKDVDITICFRSFFIHTLSLETRTFRGYSTDLHSFHFVNLRLWGASESLGGVHGVCHTQKREMSRKIPFPDATFHCVSVPVQCAVQAKSGQKKRGDPKDLHLMKEDITDGGWGAPIERK